MAGGAGGMWGMDDGALGDGDVDEGLDGVVLGLCRCVCGVVCACLGAGLGLASGLGLGSGSRLRRTSVWRCEGANVGLGVFPVRCRGA